MREAERQETGVVQKFDLNRKLGIDSMTRRERHGLHCFNGSETCDCCVSKKKDGSNDPPM